MTRRCQVPQRRFPLEPRGLTNLYLTTEGLGRGSRRAGATNHPHLHPASHPEAARRIAWLHREDCEPMSHRFCECGW